MANLADDKIRVAKYSYFMLSANKIDLPSGAFFLFDARGFLIVVVV